MVFTVIPESWQSLLHTQPGSHSHTSWSLSSMSSLHCALLSLSALVVWLPQCETSMGSLSCPIRHMCSPGIMSAPESFSILLVRTQFFIACIKDALATTHARVSDARPP